MAGGNTRTEPRSIYLQRPCLPSWAWHTCWCSLCHPSCSPPLSPPQGSTAPFPASWVPLPGLRGGGCPTLQAPDSHPKRWELEGKLGWFACEHLSFCTTVISRATAVHFGVWSHLLKYLQNQTLKFLFLLHSALSLSPFLLLLIFVVCPFIQQN